MVGNVMSNKHPVMIAAPGLAAVYACDGADFAWPLVAWLWLGSDNDRKLVGLTLSLDGRMVVRVDEIEGFKSFLPPAGLTNQAG
jgi:hypothetical protein